MPGGNFLRGRHRHGASSKGVDMPAPSLLQEGKGCRPGHLRAVIPVGLGSRQTHLPDATETPEGDVHLRVVAPRRRRGLPPRPPGPLSPHRPPVPQNAKAPAPLGPLSQGQPERLEAPAPPPNRGAPPLAPPPSLPGPSPCQPGHCTPRSRTHDVPPKMGYSRLSTRRLLRSLVRNPLRPSLRKKGRPPCQTQQNEGAARRSRWAHLVVFGKGRLGGPGVAPDNVSVCGVIGLLLHDG